MGEDRRTMTDDPQTTADETRHTINESADKIRLKTKVKRGTATRDQDVIEVKVKGDDPEETVEKLNETLAGLADTAEQVRAIQPGEQEDEA